MQPRNMPDMQTGGTRVAAVLLAAGESSRMGRMKALLPWRDEEPLVAYQARTLHAAGYGPIIIVLGHKAGLVASVLPMDVPASTVFNKHYRQGRSTSITAGVRAVASTPPDALLVTSVDQPRSVAMLRALREAWEQERPALAVPSLDGRGGHPPLFAGTLIPELLQVREETEGLRSVVQAHEGERLFVPVDDPLTLTNLNTPDDYQAALAVGA